MTEKVVTIAEKKQTIPLAKDTAKSTPFGERIPALDGIRGLAILIILAYHSMRFTSEHPLDIFLGSLRSTLWSGVDLFFVLSGFLITGILLDSKGGDRYFSNFYMRRLLRIFPLYYGVLVAVLIVLPAVLSWLKLPIPEELRVLLDRQLWLWSYTQNYLQSIKPHQLPGFGPFWSLAVEEQFYLIWPLCVYRLNQRALLRFSVGICVFALTIRVLFVFLGFDGWTIYHLTPTRLDSLVFGALGAIIIRDASLRQRMIPLLKPLAFTTLAGLSIILLSVGSFTIKSPVVSTITFTLFGLLFTVLILIVVTGGAESKTRIFFENKWLGKLGHYSYALYVFHWPIVQALRAVPSQYKTYPNIVTTQILDALIQFLLVTVISLGLAFLSWHFWEVHWLKLKRYFAYRQPS